MKYSLIIKDNVVINKVVGETLLTFYPFPFDLIIEDVNQNVLIGSIYDPITGEFSMVGEPYEQQENPPEEEVFS
jgi:hypothetical protein